MTPDPTLPEAFLILADQRLDGEITAAGQAELERHLAETPGALAHYLALANAEALLADEFPDRVRTTGLPGAARGESSRRPVRFPRPWRVALGIAALLAVVAAIWSVTDRSDRRLTASAVGTAVPAARVTKSLGVRWSLGRPGADGKLDGDIAEITGGFLELKLADGVRLLLEGPAKLTVTGRNACRLAYGKAVADVPDGAQGFTLDSPRERIVDHGTRFAVDVRDDGAETLLGVLSGEVELRHGASDVRLYTDYAVKRTGGDVLSVPFDRSRFATEIPTREFPWNMRGAKPGEERELRFDVSRLVNGPGDYRVVFKWLQGPDMLNVSSVELRRDGVAVARYDEPLSAGAIASTRGNTPVLVLRPSDYIKGRWEVVARASCQFKDEKLRKTPPQSSGIVTFEDGLALSATEKSFVGRWCFSHNGVDHVREFLPGGAFRAFSGGRRDPWGDGLRYTVKDGILTLFQRGGPPETYMLRDDGTLVFLNLPRRNAHREPERRN